MNQKTKPLVFYVLVDVVDVGIKKINNICGVWEVDKYLEY